MLPNVAGAAGISLARIRYFKTDTKIKKKIESGENGRILIIDTSTELVEYLMYLGMENLMDLENVKNKI